MWKLVVALLVIATAPSAADARSRHSKKFARHPSSYLATRFRKTQEYDAGALKFGTAKWWEGHQGNGGGSGGGGGGGSM